MNVSEWMIRLRGILAAIGLALLTLGAVLLAWPRPGGVIAVIAGGVLFAVAAWFHHHITHALGDRLHLPP